jgi:hypothetical protein
MSVGNWQFTSPLAQGYLSGSSGAVTLETIVPTTYTTQSGEECSGMTLVTFSGAITGNSVALTSPPLLKGSNTVMTITGTSYYGTNLDGVFKVTEAAPTDACYGATGKLGSTGTFSGSLVPQVSGSFSGTVNEIPMGLSGTPDSTLEYPVSVTANISQATTPDNNLHFPVSGTVTFTSSACFPETTDVPIDSAKSYMKGDEIVLNIADNSGFEIAFGENPYLPGADPYYSGTEANLYFFANPSTPINSDACGEFEWAGTLTNP